jgi:hypothetical protein
VQEVKAVKQLLLPLVVPALSNIWKLCLAAEAEVLLITLPPRLTAVQLGEILVDSIL